MTNESSGPLCGLWIDDAGRVHTCRATATGGRTEHGETFKPFAWLGAETAHEGVTLEPLKGEGTFRWLAHAESLATFGKRLMGLTATAKKQIKET